MSTDSPLNHDLPGRLDLPGLTSWLRTAVTRPVTAAAFWLAVVLPFLHLPLLATGLESTQMVTAFVGLLGLNAVALVVGHHHNRR